MVWWQTKTDTRKHVQVLKRFFCREASGEKVSGGENAMGTGGHASGYNPDLYEWGWGGGTSGAPVTSAEKT